MKDTNVIIFLVVYVVLRQSYVTRTVATFVLLMSGAAPLLYTISSRRLCISIANSYCHDIMQRHSWNFSLPSICISLSSW